MSLALYYYLLILTDLGVLSITCYTYGKWNELIDSSLGNILKFYILDFASGYSDIWFKFLSSICYIYCANSRDSPSVCVPLLCIELGSYSLLDTSDYGTIARSRMSCRWNKSSYKYSHSINL